MGDDKEREPIRPPKKPRKSRPKVRTGCLTCKIRRVKCDEKRPECLRCQKSGRTCDGYAVGLKGPPLPIAPRGQKLLALAPCQPQIVDVDQNSRSFFPKPNLKSTESNSVTKSPSLHLFDEEIEQSYFHVYCNKTARKLGGFWDASIWGRLILQACHDEPFARHAIVSIAALDLAMDEQPSPRSISSPRIHNRLVDNSHHQFALREYGKALRLMRTSSFEDEAHHVRKALISCLLIICFELYRGDPDLAMKQAKAAVNVLSSWLRKIRPSSTHGSASAPLLKGSTVVEEELVDAFARLYKGIMVFRADRPTEFSVQLMSDANARMKDMPLAFSSVAQVRKYWELHLRLALPWNHQPGFDALQASAFPKLHPDRIRNRNPPLLLPPQDEIVIQNLEEQRLMHIEHLHSWRLAFHPVWKYVLSPIGADDFSGAAILKMQSICGVISFAAAGVNHETIYDSFIGDFGEMVSLAGKILEISERAKMPGSTLFAFSIGCTNCLYFMILKCRCRKLRRQILHLLESYPRRDGVWDTAMVAAVGRWQMEKEEKGLQDEEPIPERARVRLMEAKMPSAKNEVFVKYTIMEGSPRERVMPPMETITW